MSFPVPSGHLEDVLYDRKGAPNLPQLGYELDLAIQNANSEFGRMVDDNIPVQN